MKISKYLEFRIKYILPFIASILTYVVIGLLYSRSLKETDLISINGKVSAIRQDTTYSNNTENLRITIKLVSNNNDFFLFDNTEDTDNPILKNVDVGDTVSILHRSKLQSIIGIGSEFQIMKIEKGKDILYSFDDAKQTFSFGIFGILVMIGLWLLYFFLRYKLKLEKKQLQKGC